MNRGGWPTLRETQASARQRPWAELPRRAGLEKVGELDALVADYVAESERRGEPAALPALGFELAALPLATTS